MYYSVDDETTKKIKTRLKSVSRVKFYSTKDKIAPRLFVQTGRWFES